MSYSCAKSHSLSRIVILAGIVGASYSGCGSGMDSDSGEALATGEQQGGIRSTTRFGDPLPGLPAALLTRFNAGLTEFATVEDASDGLGPVFNDVSCANCHSDPAVGGGSARVETRFGAVVGGQFDPLAQLGGSLIQERGLGKVGSCTFVGETVPRQATVVAGRRTTPLFGLGLIDAVPDSVYQKLASAEARLTPDTAGRPNLVQNLITGRTSVGKFGWKAQVPAVAQFSGDAYLNEMGITSALFPNENCPQGDCAMLACDPIQGLEDTDNSVAKFTDFMTLLAPPPRAAVSAAVTAGERVFAQAGCATCHLPVLQTGPNPVAALDRVTFFPFSDFLLHDMGSLGDGISQGQAGGREMRTAPLWGLHVETRLLHDGRAKSVADAILAHDGQGKRARDRFAGLGAKDRADLLAFLNTL